MAATTNSHVLLETVALRENENQTPHRLGDQRQRRDQSRHEFQRPVLHVANESNADGPVQRMATTTRLGLDQRSLGPFSLPCFNRLVRTRMLGGVGSAGGIPALTRLALIWNLHKRKMA